MKKYRIYIIVVLVVVIIATITVLSNKNGTSYEKEVVVLSSLKQIVNETGIIEPSQEADLSFKQSGKIISIPVSKGSIVSTGDILVYLDSKDVRKAVRDAETNLESARIELEKFQEVPDSVETRTIKKA